MTETHLSPQNDADAVNVPGYEWYPHSRVNKHVNASIVHGGVGLLVKKDMIRLFDIDILDKSRDGLLTVRMKNKHSEFSFVIFIVYCAPEGSPWSQDITDFYGQYCLKYIYTTKMI